MKPFQECDLSAVIGLQRSLVQDEIDKLPNEVIVGNDLEIIAENLYQQFCIFPVVIEDEDFSKRSVKQQKIRMPANISWGYFSGRDYVEVDGIVAMFFFPYQGETDLFKCRASTFSVSGYPEICIENGYVSFRIEKSLNEMSGQSAIDNLLKERDDNLSKIKNGVGFANKDVAAFNNSLKKEISELLMKRKKKVESFISIASMLEVPIEKKEFAKEHIPLQRKIVPLSDHYDTEKFYYISDKEYKDILDAIKHTCSTYERTPRPYKNSQEEDLRDILLATLNATYKGDATGETFRNKGKTDINIERESRAAFVAECKVWSGPKELAEAVRQLDSYLTWRDCKTAIIYFVRRKDFMAILEKSEDALKNIDGMKRVESVDKNVFDCQFYSKSNIGQLVRIRVMLFNLYCE